MSIMESLLNRPAAITQPTSLGLKLDGCWNAQNMGNIELQLATIKLSANTSLTANCHNINAMDSIGAMVLQKFLQRLKQQNSHRSKFKSDKGFCKNARVCTYTQRNIATACQNGKRSKRQQQGH